MKRVVKLGGSLLLWPDWPNALIRWVESQKHCTTVILVGGGPAVDAIRKLDRVCGLTPLPAHRAALRMMDLNSEICAAQVPEWPLTEGDACETTTPNRTGTTWIKLADWVLTRSQLPASWDVTSDSIAAAFAAAIGAAEVVLLKSSLPEISHAEKTNANPKMVLQGLSVSGYLDACFESLLPCPCRVRMVNLRSTFAQEILVEMD